MRTVNTLSVILLRSNKKLIFFASKLYISYVLRNELYCCCIFAINISIDENLDSS